MYSDFLKIDSKKILRIPFPPLFFLEKFLERLFNSPKKILVLGRPQSGKTTFYNSLLLKEIDKEEYEATNYQAIKEFTITYKEKKIIIAEGVDLPGTLEEQINRLNIDVKKFFKNETSNLIIYIVNCNEIDKQPLIEHAGRVLNIAACELYGKAPVAIFYSHPDELGYKSKDVTTIHKRFIGNLKKCYPRVADKIDEYSLHYVVNLTKQKETLKVLFETFKRIEK